MSPLLRLPAEIRNAIWKLAVGGHRVDPPKGDAAMGRYVKGGAFVAKNTPTVGSLLASDNADDRIYEILRRHREYLAVLSGRDHEFAFSRMQDMECAPTAFHLPEVCRQIYADTAITAYGLSIFMLDREDGDWIDTLSPGQLHAIAQVEPFVYLAVDMYSGCINSVSENSRMRSLRQRFRNLKEVHITEDTVRRIMFANHGGPDWQKETERDSVVALIKEKEGDDVVVIFQEEAFPWLMVHMMMK